MYDPAVQRALLETLARWRRLPEGDLVHMLSPVERLRYRDDALQDLAWEGLVTITNSGDELVIDITPAGDAWLERRRAGRSESK
jgi:hypothetical protein